MGSVSFAACTATSAAVWSAATPWSSAVAGSREAGLEAVDGRNQRVEQRLVTEGRLAALHDPGDRSAQHRDQLLPR